MPVASSSTAVHSLLLDFGLSDRGVRTKVAEFSSQEDGNQDGWALARATGRETSTFIHSMQADGFASMSEDLRETMRRRSTHLRERLQKAVALQRLCEKAPWLVFQLAASVETTADLVLVFLLDTPSQEGICNDIAIKASVTRKVRLRRQRLLFGSGRALKYGLQNRVPFQAGCIGSGNPREESGKTANWPQVRRSRDGTASFTIDGRPVSHGERERWDAAAWLRQLTSAQGGFVSFFVDLP